MLQVAAEPPERQGDKVKEIAKPTKRIPEEIAADKREKAERQAAKRARQEDERRVQADRDAAVTSMAVLVLELPEPSVRSFVERAEAAPLARISQLVSAMRALRPEQFEGEHDEALSGGCRGRALSRFTDRSGDCRVGESHLADFGAESVSKSRFSGRDLARISLMLNRRFAQANRPPEGTSWCWLTAEMLESPAWRALTGNALKVVLRIALEHLKHGGVENGLLPVTYKDFGKPGSHNTTALPRAIAGPASNLTQTLRRRSRLLRRSWRKFDAFPLSSIDKENRLPPPKALLGQVTVPILAPVTTRYLARATLHNLQVTTAILLSISRLGAILTEPVQFPPRASHNSRMPST